MDKQKWPEILKTVLEQKEENYWIYFCHTDFDPRRMIKNYASHTFILNYVRKSVVFGLQYCLGISVNGIGPDYLV